MVFPFVSVGATENLMMAAALRRPHHIAERGARTGCKTLVIAASNGRTDQGIGTDTITIDGVEALHGAVHSVYPTGSRRARSPRLRPSRAETSSFGSGPYAYRKFCGCDESGRNFMEPTDAGIRVMAINGRVAGVDAMTEPYPDFRPTSRRNSWH